jgi:phosphatidylethanolamine/phosphatidyl-N-methylethanolamine N-methyltransferase
VNEPGSEIDLSTMMQTHAVVEAYDRWAPIYDLVFGNVFKTGRALAVEAADAIGGRILEAGIGTGISLPLYRQDSRLTGIDISDAMLNKARQRVRRQGLEYVEELMVMDIEQLCYENDSFDAVVAQYVVTAVPNPERALDELLRVLRPGGEIIITTRISADAGLRDFVEMILAPLTGRLGWRTKFSWSRYEAWAETRPQIRLIENRPLPPFGHFSLVRFGKLPNRTDATPSSWQAGEDI